MPDDFNPIELLLQRYFVRKNEDLDHDAPNEDLLKGSIQIPVVQSGSLLHPWDGNQVDYMIDGEDYFGNSSQMGLNHEIDLLLGHQATGSFFYFANYWLGLVEGPKGTFGDPMGAKGAVTSAWSDAPNVDVSLLKPFRLPGAAKDLIDQLEEMAKAGIDVRGFPWVSGPIAHYQAAEERAKGIWSTNIHTLLSVKELRTKSGLSDKIVIDTLSHPLGSMHLKMVICGDDTRMSAYLSGLDFVDNRLATWEHDKSNWHDAGARVQGPAAGVIYNFFKKLWDEQVTRVQALAAPTNPASVTLNPRIIMFNVNGTKIPSHLASWGILPARQPPQPVGTQNVQVLRTLPQMNFAVGATPVLDTVDCPTRTFADVKQEPFSFAPKGVFEFRAALRKAILNANKYIYIEDQAFSALEVMDWINQRLKDIPELKVILLHGRDPADPGTSFMIEAVNKHLIPGIPNPNDRIVFYERGNGIVVHAKVTIIDDEWAVVGTANCMRRSLYTDTECSVAVLEVDDPDKPSFAKRLRKDLWGEHCNLSPTPSGLRDQLLELTGALNIWHSKWGKPIPSTAQILLKPEIKRKNLPFSDPSMIAGLIMLTHDSPMVEGIGTAWTDDLNELNKDGKNARFLLVTDGDDKTVYQIQEVISAKKLKLTRAYKGSSSSPEGNLYKLSKPDVFLIDEASFFDKIDYDRADPDSRQTV